MSNHGKIWWNELVAKDLDASQSFYQEVIGWEYEAIPMSEGSYAVAKAPGGEGPSAGMFLMPAEWGDMPPHWVAYICVDDVDATAAKVEASGGTLLEKPFTVEGVGRIAILADPGGARIGLMTPADQA
ncbi:MAG: VOC family protein [Proteobacteria bacterium]|nr:VOC family protein [Pseudomonadota bacterium]